MHLKLALTLLVCISSAFGQASGGLAGISGVVRDPSGAVVPGARVVISSDTQGALRTVNTNDDGLFSAPALAPGAGYKVEVTASGFAGYANKDITLLVGQNINLNIALTVAAGTTQIEVSTAVALVEDTKTDVSQVIDSQQIQELPINGRRVDSFVLLTPGVTNDGTFGLLTFRGVAGQQLLPHRRQRHHRAVLQRERRPHPHRLADLAGRRAGVPGGFGQLLRRIRARHGRRRQHRDEERHQRHPRHGLLVLPQSDSQRRDRVTPRSIRPRRATRSAPASAAPIKKDKLFYFFNTEITRRNFPLLSSYIRAGVIDTNAQTFLGCGAPATPAQCAAINTLLPRFFGLLTRRADQELGFGRLDYHLSERNTFSASLNYQHFVSPNGIQTAITNTSGGAINSNGDDSVRVRNARARLDLRSKIEPCQRIPLRLVHRPAGGHVRQRHPRRRTGLPPGVGERRAPRDRPTTCRASSRTSDVCNLRITPHG